MKALPKPDVLVEFSNLVQRDTQGYVADPFFDPTDRTRIFCELRSIPHKKQIASISVENSSAELECILPLKSTSWWAYPFAFQINDDILLLPSRNYPSGPSRPLQLFAVESSRVSLVRTFPVKGVDPVVFSHQGTHVMLCGKNSRKTRMQAFVSSSLFDDDWEEVPLRVPFGVRRMGGRPTLRDGMWIAPFQQYWRHYGFSTVEFRILIDSAGINVIRMPGLTRLAGSNLAGEWNARGMHTFDMCDGWSVADGRRSQLSDEWSIGVFQVSLQGTRMSQRERPFREKATMGVKVGSP